MNKADKNLLTVAYIPRSLVTNNVDFVQIKRKRACKDIGHDLPNFYGSSVVTGYILLYAGGSGCSRRPISSRATSTVIVLLAAAAGADDQLQWCGLIESRIRHLISKYSITDEIMLGKCGGERLFEAPNFFARYKHFIVLLAGRRRRRRPAAVVRPS
ncbi:hypothetical protein ACJJTC_016616 [Scirpophaga incertulas]